jgi:hypothetical protein
MNNTYLLSGQLVMYNAPVTDEYLKYTIKQKSQFAHKEQSKSNSSPLALVHDQ